MSNSSVKHIVDEFDQILSDDKNLSTRTGLRLSMSVLREAVGILGDIQNDYEKLNERVHKIEEERRQEKEKREKQLKDEEWLRRTAIGTALTAFILLVFNGIIFLLSTVPLIRQLLEMTAK